MRTAVSLFLRWFAIGFAVTWLVLSWNEARADEVLGGRPPGCPHAYCGCGLARYLGIHDARLNLAWNWARFFPHTYAHSGAAAVRRHHVFLLREHVRGPFWLALDFNGGRHRTWLHVRDTRGYVFVNPSYRVGGL